MNAPNDHQDATLILSARDRQRSEDIDALRQIFWMYTQYATRIGLRSRAYTIDRTIEDEYWRLVIEVEGSYAYGRLSGEDGVHRVTNNSVGGSVHVRVAPSPSAPLPDEEIELQMIRSGGRNCFGRDTSSGVRAIHQPTQTSVYCIDERSQYRNRQDALRALSILVYGEMSSTLRRSYHLAPSSYVRDHRLGIEASDANEVLGGVLDTFVRGHVRRPLEKLQLDRI
jgi:protein subunit release factor A